MNITVKKRLLLAFLFSICFMAFLLSRVEWKHFSLIAGRLDTKYLFAACSVFLFGNLIRTYRFVQLDHTHKKLQQWWSINAFYNFITATLPGGTGEAATAYVLKRVSRFDILGAFRILLLSRFMDLYALSALFFPVSVQISSDTPYREAAIWLAGILFIISSIVLIPASERLVLRLLQRLPGNISFIEKLCTRLNELLAIAKDRHTVSFYTVTLMQSALCMITGFATLHLLLLSFGIDFTPIQSTYCFGIYAVFQIIPVQGVAGIGTQAAWFALALNAAGYKGIDVVAMGIVLHGTFYVFITILGLSALPVWLLTRESS